ncbi:MAG: hypothetical protein IKZ08_02445 [Bacteroidales bacterium]|nr:hypothetical protein [Bacteroidales bacterium]
MTCKEWLIKENPALDEDEIETIIRDECPHHYDGLEAPEQCNPRQPNTCRECWDREIPEKKTPDFLEKGMHIKDSGDRTQFESGAVRDMREGKGRCDLMPLEVAGRLLNDPMLATLKEFLDTGNTQCLYRCLVYFSAIFDDGKTKGSLQEIETQRKCTMLLEVAKHYEEGAKKYGENNWQKGLPVYCYIDSAVRHYLKWLRGDKDEPHDRAFVWNLMCCIWEVDYSPRAGKETQHE